MERILLLLEHRENRCLLSEWLATRYEVIAPNLEAPADSDAGFLQSQSFDLCLVGARALNRFWQWVQARRQAEQPVLLPFLLVTVQPDVSYLTRHLGSSVDDLITQPTEKIELQARVETLLRSRQLSLQLKAANQKLEQQITARQQAEAGRDQAIAAHHQSQAQFQQLVESNLIGMIAGNTQGLITDANQAFLEIIGYSRADLTSGIDWDALTPPEYHSLDEQAILQLKVSGVCTPFEKEYVRSDGTRVPVLIGAVAVEPFTKSDRSSPLNYVAFTLDLSERKQVAAALHQSEERFRQMAETIQSVFWLFDPQSQQVLYLSPAYEQIWGRSRHDLYADFSHWIETIHPADRQRIQAAPTHCLATGNYDVEYRVLRPDGSIRWVRDRGFVVADAKGHPYRLAGVAEDITDRKQAEADREQLLVQEQAAREEAEQANRIKDEFLAVLSHELRTPLNPILGWAKLLRSRPYDPALLARALETIERNAKLQIQLIEDLLDISRILSGKLILNVGYVDLAATIRAALETVSLAAEAKAIEIQIELATVPLICGDADRLQQVIWNLLSNAIKFTSAGGTVQIRLEQIQTYAQITVRDSGKGISPDFLPYVFESFRQADGSTTRKFGGLGLGLAIVRQVTELHGGTIQASSPGEGQGATFTIKLPLLKLGSVSQPDSIADTTTDLSGVKILVVDDEPDIRDFLSFLLIEKHASVIAVASANEALTALSHIQPDVLLSDIGMPEVDGYGLIRQIRSLSPDQGGQIPAIALTAYAGELNQQQALSAGFQQHLAKPVEPERLMQAIAQAVRLEQVESEK